MNWILMTTSVTVALLAILLYLDTSSAFTLSGIFDGVQSLQNVLAGHDAAGAGTVSAEGKSHNIMYHMGGNSPWIPKKDGVLEDGIDPPAGCVVDQVHMISRHAERYPTVLAGIRMLELFQHLQHADVTLGGDLSFANDWDFFMKDPSTNLENLVAVGPYAGTLEAFKTGVKLRTRYEHLLDDAIANNQTAFWASGSKRVIETAEYFAAGFFGLSAAALTGLQVIPETESLAGDTLTPGKTCFRYVHDADEYGRNYGVRMFNQWRSTYLPPIIERLAKQNPGIVFTETEVYSMQELCGFETIAKGGSRWCEVFSEEEWEQFEYARDLLHCYRSGPGNPYSSVMGSLWLNATASLLHEGPSSGPLFFSFVHDGDINPLLAALELLPAQLDLPTSHVVNNRTWRTSDIVPMGGRLIFERLACPRERQCWDNSEYGYPNHLYCEPTGSDYFVRLNVNDGIMELPGCTSGPGQSCPLSQFLDRVKRRGEEVGDFREVCGLRKDAAAGITFLHQ